MKNQLSDNIRKFRKERGLTQEQLADVFNVTVGAVHKWEAGMSVPDITLIMEIADFFDVSLDALTGFGLRDNSAEELANRLRRLSDALDPNAIEEAERALKKYPNNFKIVYESAYLYKTFGARFKIDRNLCQRSMELYGQAIRLAQLNTDPNIDETLIYSNIANIYHLMGDLNKALEIYKAHNAGYIHNANIGQLLVALGRYEEAETYLSYAFVGHIGNRVNLISSKALCYRGSGNYEEAKAILELGLSDNESLRRGIEISYLDKIDCLFLTGLACIELDLNNRKKAKDLLIKAKEKGEVFDGAPEYDARKERFVDIKEPCMAYDTAGETCLESIKTTIDMLGSKELKDLWKSINK